MHSPTLYEVQQEIKDYFINGSLDIKDLDKDLSTKKNLYLSKSTYEELSIYKSLIIDSLSEALANIYPLTSKLLKFLFLKEFSDKDLCSQELNIKWQEHWQQITRDYMQQYPSDSPIFNEVAKDFPEFLKVNNYEPAYVFELAFYEWVMLALFLHEDLDSESQVTPVHLLCSFNFSILEIAEALGNDKFDFTNIAKAQNIFFYRDSESNKVKTFLLSSLTSFVIARLTDNMPKVNILEEIVTNFNIEESQLVKIREELGVLFRELEAKNILLS